MTALIAKGLGVSQGKISGRVRIIRTREDHASFKRGDILVTRLTDPTMTSLMGRAGGIICDIGGMTSHPSVLSRELGIPCIVSARCLTTGKSITEILQDGQLIEMCGSEGMIHAAEAGIVGKEAAGNDHALRIGQDPNKHEQKGGTWKLRWK